MGRLGGGEVFYNPVISYQSVSEPVSWAQTCFQFFAFAGVDFSFLSDTGRLEGAGFFCFPIFLRLW